MALSYQPQVTPYVSRPVKLAIDGLGGTFQSINKARAWRLPALESWRNPRPRRCLLRCTITGSGAPSRDSKAAILPPYENIPRLWCPRIRVISIGASNSAGAPSGGDIAPAGSGRRCSRRPHNNKARNDKGRAHQSRSRRRSRRPCGRDESGRSSDGQHSAVRLTRGRRRSAFERRFWKARGLGRLRRRGHLRGRHCWGALPWPVRRRSQRQRSVPPLVR